MRREKKVNPTELAKMTSGYSAADISQTCEKALKKSIIEGSKMVLQDHITWAIREQSRQMKVILGDGT